jgi:uncharacterized protein with HEPN domain
MMPMSERDRVYIGHMLDTAEQAARRIEGVERACYDADEDLRIVLTYLVQVFGEAASHVSDECKASVSELPWRQIVGMRNRLVHDYMHVDFDVVWSVVTNDLPRLTAVLRGLLDE